MSWLRRGVGKQIMSLLSVDKVVRRKGGPNAVDILIKISFLNFEFFFDLQILRLDLRAESLLLHFHTWICMLMILHLVGRIPSQDHHRLKNIIMNILLKMNFWTKDRGLGRIIGSEKPWSVTLDGEV